MKKVEKDFLAELFKIFELKLDFKPFQQNLEKFQIELDKMFAGLNSHKEVSLTRLENLEEVYLKLSKELYQSTDKNLKQLQDEFTLHRELSKRVETESYEQMRHMKIEIQELVDKKNAEVNLRDQIEHFR